MKKEEFMKVVDSLKIPKEKYFILSGGSLLLHNIREETEDIDIGITEAVFKELKQRYEPVYERQVFDNKYPLYQLTDKIEVTVMTEEELKQFRRDMVLGYPTEPIEDILEFKKKRNLEKDKKDIQRLKEYMESKQNKEV